MPIWHDRRLCRPPKVLSLNYLICTNPRHSPGPLWIVMMYIAHLQHCPTLTKPNLWHSVSIERDPTNQQPQAAEGSKQQSVCQLLSVRTEQTGQGQVTRSGTSLRGWGEKGVQPPRWRVPGLWVTGWWRRNNKYSIIQCYRCFNVNHQGNISRFGREHTEEMKCWNLECMECIYYYHGHNVSKLDSLYLLPL